MNFNFCTLAIAMLASQLVMASYQTAGEEMEEKLIEQNSFDQEFKTPAPKSIAQLKSFDEPHTLRLNGEQKLEAMEIGRRLEALQDFKKGVEKAIQNHEMEVQKIKEELAREIQMGSEILKKLEQEYKVKEQEIVKNLKKAWELEKQLEKDELEAKGMRHNIEKEMEKGLQESKEKLKRIIQESNQEQE